MTDARLAAIKPLLPEVYHPRRWREFAAVVGGVAEIVSKALIPRW